MVCWLADARRWNGAVDAVEAGRTLTADAADAAGRGRNADAAVLAGHVVASARETGAAVAAGERPRTLALVRVDAVDARAAVVARGVQALVDVLLAGGTREARLAAAHERRRGAVVVVVVVCGSYAVAVAVGRARIGRAWRGDGVLAALALTALKARLAHAHGHARGRVQLDAVAHAAVVAAQSAAVAFIARARHDSGHGEQDGDQGSTKACRHCCCVDV